MKKYTIEITDDGKTINMSRKNDGFSAMELIGFMEMTKQDLINQFKGLAEDEVDIITKQAVKKGFECPICKKTDMVWDGNELLSDPPQYKYTCPSCGLKATRSE